MADNLKSIPISSLPEAETLETDDQIIAYRSDNGKAYRSNVGSLSEAAQGAISDAFSTTKAYSAGDYCIYNDTLYKFTDDKDIGAWDDSVVEKTTATAEIQSNTDLIDSLSSDVEIPQNADLNDYLTDGRYIANSSSISQTLTNCPTAGSFLMLVYKMHNSSTFQIIITNQNACPIFVRRVSSGAGTWYQLTSTAVS